MLVPVKDTEGHQMIAVAMRPISSMQEVKDLRDCIAATLEVCVSYKEAKEASNPYHLYLLSKLNQVLTEDIEKGSEE